MNKLFMLSPFRFIAFGKRFAYDVNLLNEEITFSEEDFDNANGFLAGLLNGQYEITRIIEIHKKKIKDLSEDEMQDICNRNLCGTCPLNLGACIFELLQVNPSALSSDVLEALVEVSKVPDDLLKG